MTFLKKPNRLFAYAILLYGLTACDADDGENGIDGAQGPQGVQGPAGEDGRDLTNPALATSIDLGPFDCTAEELAENADKNCRLYIKGSMNSWSSRPEAELTHQGNGVYIALFKMNQGDFSFKISDPDWSAERDLATGTDVSAAITLDTPMMLQRKYTADDGAFYDNQNMDITVTGDDQIFRFTLDASDTINNPTLLIENITESDTSNLTKPLYLVGSFNNYTAHEDFLFEYVGAGNYEVFVEFTESQYVNFQVQQGDEYSNKYGSLKDDTLTLHDGTSVLTTTPGGQMASEVVAGVYKFTISMLGDGQLGVPVTMQKVRATAGHDQVTGSNLATNLTSDGSLFAETFAWSAAGTVLPILTNDETQAAENARVNAVAATAGSYTATLTINQGNTTEESDSVTVDVLDLDGVKNIVFLIGDGMGYGSVEAARMYKGAPLAMEGLPGVGEMLTASADTLGYELNEINGDDYFTDSAAAGTALATGRKASAGVISVAVPGDGSDLKTIMEYARDAGMSIGVVATADCAHATPASFVAHGPNRNDYAQLSESIYLEVQPNLTFCGTRTYQNNGTDMHTVNATAGGYTIVNNETEMNALVADATYANNSYKLAGLFGPKDYANEHSGIPYVANTEGHTYAAYDIPTVAEMSAKAIEIMSQNPNGFMLMIEGSQIDWAGHSNSIVDNVQETLAFDDAIAETMAWANGRTDTSVVVTADHECGGLTVDADNGAGEYPTVSWKWGSHTNWPVPVYTWGVNADAFDARVFDNTSIFNVMLGGIQAD